MAGKHAIMLTIGSDLTAECMGVSTRNIEADLSLGT